MALPQAGVELVANGLSGFVSDMNKASTAVTDFGKSGDSASKGFGGFQQIVTGALREVGALAVDAMGKAAQAVGSFVKDSIGLAGDFQSGMLEFQAVAGKDVDTKGLEKFQDLFLTLGKELPVSTADVQKAAIEMVKGGIDPATVAAGGLRQNIQFAAAAMGGDLVQAATISAKILGGWTDSSATAQQKADFLTHSTDLLTKAANASSVDVHELSLGIFNAQGVAQTAGVQFDDLTTTLALLAPRFASSSEAGNSLKNVIARLQPTTQPAIDAMTALGLITEDGSNKFYDAQGNFIGFQQASQLLQDSLVGLTAQQQQQVLQTIFGNDAMNAAAGLATAGAAGYQTMADSLANANGVADAAALKQQGFNTAMENAKGSVEALQITIGSALLPVLTDLLNNVVAPAVNTFTDMASAVFGNQEAFNNLSPAAQGVVSTIQMLVGDVQNIIGAFSTAGASSSEFASAIGQLASDLGLPGDLIQNVVSGIQQLVSWFNQAGSGAGNLGGAVKDLSGIWEKAVAVVGNVMEGYQAIAQAVLPIVAGFIDAHGAEISAFFKTTWDQIVRIVQLALDLYNAIVPPILKAIAGFISAHSTEIQTILGGAWNVISGIVSAALALIEGVIRTVLAVINGDWSGAWTAIQTMSVTFVESIGKVISGFLTVIAGFFGTTLGDIAKTWQDNWDAMVKIVGTIAGQMVQAGTDIVAGIQKGISDAWSAFLTWVGAQVGGVVKAALDAIGAGSPAKEFMPVGQFAIQGIMAGMEGMLPALSTLIEQISASLIEGLTKNKDKMSKKLSEAADALIAQAKGLAEDINGAIADGFGATASIDRQLASNLDKFKDVLPQYQQATAGALKQAEQAARQFTDPTQGARFFKLRSDQILEYAKLQKNLADAQDRVNASFTVQEDQTSTIEQQNKAIEDRRSAYADIAKLQQQMLLINAAQTSEIDAFNADLKSAQNPIEKIGDAFRNLLEGNDLIKLPGILENPLIAQITSLLSQLSQPPANPWANPPASAQQIYNGGSTTPYSSNVNYNYNMPVYTNQSPSVLMDSMAIAQASMP